MFKKFLLVAVMLVAFTGSALMAQDLMKLIPSEADFVFQVNISKFVSNPDVKKSLMENLQKSPEQKKAFDEFVANTGFNPMENLSQIIIFTSGKIDPKAPAQNAGAIMAGTFNSSRIMEAIKKDPNAGKDVEITKIDGFDAIVPRDKKDGFGIFLDDKTAVLGTELGVNAVKDVKKGTNKGAASRKDFFAVLQKLDLNASVSGAGLIPADLKEKLKANPQAAPLAALNFFFFSFNHGDTIEFNFNGEVDKKENVETVTTSLNGFLAMLKMLTAQAPEVGEILNMVKISTGATTVQIALSVPKAKLDEIKAKMEQRIKEMKEKGATEVDTEGDVEVEEESERE
ncbi:MAG: hypothetical protein CVV42_09495 [Candidatus Riflebacteria bacterium HGW-Riflebacteria-2]|jgi:hypothetical protein|nr:MAG: hypothetical protein CVV42_09495 [Candidatus Riflebacteria bacterium HGW-Riflebacteria-2]